MRKRPAEDDPNSASRIKVLRPEVSAEQAMKFIEQGPYAEARKAARRILEIANSVEPVQGGRIHIEKINGPFLREGGTPPEYGAGLEYAIARGWLWKHESGTYVKFTPAGASCSREGKTSAMNTPSTWWPSER